MTSTDLKQTIELYDPHPGFAGAAIPLPKPMKEFVNKLDGRHMSLEEALETLSPVAEGIGGTVEVVGEYQYIGFTYIRNGREHFFKLISYR